MNVYEKNMNALARRHVELVPTLLQGVDTSHISVQTAASGAYRLQVTTQEGEEVFVHGDSDPVATARETAEALPLEGNLVVLLGFGLGYLGLELLKKLDKGHFLLICEADLAMFETALHYTDLEPLLLSEQVKILTGEDIPVGAWFHNYGAKYLNSKAFLIKYDPCYRIAPERYQHLEEQIQETTHVLDVNATTLFSLGRLFLQNQLKNMPWIRRCPGVRRLTNAFAGRPGIVVAAGPSLEKNYLLLKEAKNRAVIIATDTVLPLLLPHEILPDIVVTLDPQEMNYGKFRDLEFDPRVSLAFTPQSYPEIVQNYPGGKFVTASLQSIYLRFAPFWEEKGHIAINASSVTHVALNLAKLLGVDPIVFVGLDLCFPEQKTHARNLSMPSDRVPTNLEVWTTDIFGERVPTSKLFKGSQVLFEQMIQDTAVHCIDATEGGARLAGTEVMRLREVIDAYCQITPLGIDAMIRRAAADIDPCDTAGLIAELKRVSHQVRTMRKTSRNILRYVRILEKMKHDGKTADPRYTRFSELVERATAYMRDQRDILEMLPSHAYKLELYMSQQHVIDIDDIEEEEERFAKQLERAQVYYQPLVEVLDPFAQGIDSLIKRLETELKLDVARVDSRNASGLSLALQYKEMGYYDRAIPLLQECLRQEPTHAKALFHLIAVYLQQGRYRDALQLLEQGKQTHPHSRGMQKLYVEYQQKIARWEQRLHAALQHSQPTEKKSLTEELLEAGHFYFRVHDLKRAKSAYRKLLHADPCHQEAHYRLAHVYFADADVMAGVAELEELLRQNPDNPMVYRDLAWVACNHGEPHQAERFLRQAIELDPDDPSSYETLAQLYVQDEAWQQAAQVYEVLLCLEPQRPDILQNLAVIYHKQIAASVD